MKIAFWLIFKRINDSYAPLPTETYVQKAW